MTPTKDEVLRLALEALKTCRIDGDGWSGPHYDFDDVKVGKAIIAIRQALEQPVATNDTSKDRVDETAKQRHEPEPVAWLYIEPNNPHLNVHYDDVDVSQFPNDEWFPVYKQSKREWQGLTDEERDNIILGRKQRWEIAHMIEAKLKERNI